MEFMRPSSWDEALAAKRAVPDAVPIQGGTDLMVELNFRRTRPSAIIDLRPLTELRDVEREDGHLRIGAGVSYTQLLQGPAAALPGLTIASRTIGSPQIRNRGTVGGNLGTASPAGDAHPPLLATGGEVEAASVGRSRRIPIDEFFVGPGRHALNDDELIAAIRVPVASGPQQFAKIGTRNAMIIAACSFSVAIEPISRKVGTGIGSAGPTPLRATEAEAFLAGVLEEEGAWDGGRRIGASALERFGELVAAAARPIDDVRASAAYRRHALKVLAQRTAAWACQTPDSARNGG